jgi:transposase
MKSNQPKASAKQMVRDIHKVMRWHNSTENKIRIVHSGLRVDDSIADLCRKEGIARGFTTAEDFLKSSKNVCSYDWTSFGSVVSPSL